MAPPRSSPSPRHAGPSIRTGPHGDPSDQTEPDPVPAEVIDGDGDVWRRASSTGTWYMPGWDHTVHDERCADFLSWQELVDEFGPLTTVVGNTTADGM